MGLDIEGHGKLGIAETKYHKLKSNINKIVLYKTIYGFCEMTLYGLTKESALIGVSNIDNLLTDDDIKKSMTWVDINHVITKYWNE